MEIDQTAAPTTFENRTEAGAKLARVLREHDISADVVLAVPRGGLPVGRVVADTLGLPLDIVAARKISAPWNDELAIGAVASDGSIWLNDVLVAEQGIRDKYIDRQASLEQRNAREKVERYRIGRPLLDLRGKSVLLVDDGIATGATISACIRQIQNAGATRIVVAVPVAPPRTVNRLNVLADDVIAVETPPHFRAIGQFYDNFTQVTDLEARSFLRAVS